MNVVLPPPDDHLLKGARKVVEVLRGAGHEAWVVGGAARDLAMGVTPKEYDIATSARPDAVIGLFRKTVPVGVQFGVVRVRLMGEEYEVATLRAEEGHSDGRRPDAVRFTDLREDVTRRDFTINGLAMDPFDGEVVDLVGGLDDLREGVVRAIGDARRRFAEDRLRPLRAIRFAARTGFRIDIATFDAIREFATAVTDVSAERVQDEVGKALATPRPGLALRLLHETGILAVVLPEVGAADAVAAVAGTLDRLAGAPAVALWAALLWPAGAAAASAAMERLRHSNRMRAAVVDAIETGRAAAGLPFDDVVAEKRLLRRDAAASGVPVLEAWLAATGADPAPGRVARARMAAWGREDLFPPRLATGNDAMEAGVPRGPQVASALASLEDEQLRGRVTTREGALEFLRRHARSG